MQVERWGEGGGEEIILLNTAEEENFTKYKIVSLELE